MTTFFTSDQHYGHRNIIQYSDRPFADLVEMHTQLVGRHNSVVGPKDIVYHLGDFALDERLVKEFLPQLNGSHHLIVGNHDKCHPCHRKNIGAKKRYYDYGFKSVNRQIQLGQFLVNHLPYIGDSGHEARYPEWRPKNQGAWLLHGHVHEIWKVRDRMINVGVDQWNYTPVDMDTIMKLTK